MSIVVLVATESRDLHKSADPQNLVNSLGVDWRELIFGSVPLLLRPDEETFKVHLGQVTATSLIFRLTPSDLKGLGKSSDHLTRRVNRSHSERAPLARRASRPSPQFSGAIIGVSVLWQCPPRVAWHRLSCHIERLKQNVHHALNENSPYLLSNVIDEFIQRQVQLQSEMHMGHLMSLSNCSPGYTFLSTPSASASLGLLVSEFGSSFVADVLSASLICYNNRGKQKLILSSATSGQLLAHFLFVISSVIEWAKSHKAMSKQADKFDCVRRRDVSCSNYGVDETIVCDNSFDNSTVVVDRVSFHHKQQCYDNCNKSSAIDAQSEKCSYCSTSTSDAFSQSYPLASANTSVFTCTSSSSSSSSVSSTASKMSSSARAKELPRGGNLINSKCRLDPSSESLDCINVNSVCTLHVDHLYKVSLIDATCDNCCYEPTCRPNTRLTLPSNGDASHFLGSCACVDETVDTALDNHREAITSVAPVAPKGISQIASALSLSPPDQLRPSEITGRRVDCSSCPSAATPEENDADEEESVFAADKVVNLDPIAVANQLVMREATRRTGPVSSALLVSRENSRCPLSTDEESLGYFSSFSSSQGSTAGNEVGCTEDFSTLDPTACISSSSSNITSNSALAANSSCQLDQRVPQCSSSSVRKFTSYDAKGCDSLDSLALKQDDICEEINSSRGFLREYRDLRFNKPIPTPPPSPVPFYYQHEPVHGQQEPTFFGEDEQGDSHDRLFQEPAAIVEIGSKVDSMVTPIAAAAAANSANNWSSEKRNSTQAPAGRALSFATTLIPVEEKDSFLHMYLQSTCNSDTRLLPSSQSSSRSSCRCSFASCHSKSASAFASDTIRTCSPIQNHHFSRKSTDCFVNGPYEDDFINLHPGHDYLQPHYLIQGLIRKKQRDLSDLISHLQECSCDKWPSSDLHSQYRLVDLDCPSIDPPISANGKGSSILQDALDSIVKCMSLGASDQAITDLLTSILRHQVPLKADLLRSLPVNGRCSSSNYSEPLLKPFGIYEKDLQLLLSTPSSRSSSPCNRAHTGVNLVYETQL